jgi:hypothetical protein
VDLATQELGSEKRNDMSVFGIAVAVVVVV